MTLDDILGFGGPIASLASGLFGGKKAPKGLNELLAVERERNQLARESIAKRNQAARTAEILNAMTLNARNPLMRRIASEEEGNIRADLVQAADLVRRQNRRYGGRGGNFVNPERADEAISGNLIRGFADAKGRARNAARSWLAQASRGSLGAASAYSNIQPSTQGFTTQMQASQAERDRRTDAIKSGLRGVYDVYKTSRPQERSFDAGDELRRSAYASAPHPHHW